MSRRSIKICGMEISRVDSYVACLGKIKHNIESGGTVKFSAGVSFKDYGEKFSAGVSFKGYGEKSGI